jgi:endonuclease YncB( thermonuclease family)
MGTLRINGTIDITQFWPLGSSDADTTKIKLVVNTNSFSYRKTGSKKFVKTKAFVGAESRGQVSKEVISTSKKTGEQTITVRLQGVDAPELHYKAAPLKRTSDITDAERKKYNDINKEERRQPLAETATVALAKHLKLYATKKGEIKATYESEVDLPGDAVDTYGRFVGNIRIGSHDVNTWLVENGWGHPAFYTSMSKEEINIFLQAWKKGATKTGRTGKALSRNATLFDWKMVYRAPNKEAPIKFTMGEDKGKVLMPKIFRRQVAWKVGLKAGVLEKGTSFKTYLESKTDDMVLLNDFLENGVNSAKVYHLDDFVDKKNQVLKKPEELVFKEKAAILYNSDGSKVEKW